MNPAQAMACPVDGTVLVMSERQGIEIDYCPSCRGVWLDRGELDKLIERNAARTSAAAATFASATSAPRQAERHHGYGKPYERRKSFLEELFD
jgi:Zn-finger nucleic acid-binding protein